MRRLCEHLADLTDMMHSEKASMTIYAVCAAIALKISGDGQPQAAMTSSVRSKASCSYATGSIECDPLQPRFLSVTSTRAFFIPVHLSSLCRQVDMSTD